MKNIADSLHLAHTPIEEYPLRFHVSAESYLTLRQPQEYVLPLIFRLANPSFSEDVSILKVPFCSGPGELQSINESAGSFPIEALAPLILFGFLSGKFMSPSCSMLTKSQSDGRVVKLYDVYPDDPFTLRQRIDGSLGLGWYSLLT